MMDNQFLKVMFMVTFYVQISNTEDKASQYIGCYKDMEFNHAMSLITTDQSARSSIQGCLDFCRSNRYTFSGLKAATECHCGEDFTRHGVSDSCNTPCTDNSGDICGGNGVLSVYSTCPQGKYGKDCERPCPYTCSSLKKKMCHVTTGKCCDGSQSIPHCNFFNLKECGEVDGDPREGVSDMPWSARTNFNLFKTLSFPDDGELYEVEYYTHRGNATQFLSIWRNLQGDNYIMVAKLEVSPTEAGLQNLSLSMTGRVFVQQGDAIALHYPSSNSEANMIPYAETNILTEGISNSDLHEVASISISGETWHPGYRQDMPTHYKKKTAALALKYSCIDGCLDGQYGDMCQYKCHNCKDNVTCHFEDGTCPHGCVPGYKGFKCSEVCDIGYYGENCNSTCSNCEDGATCHHIDGHCKYGCMDGYKGFRCSEVCDPGTYGPGCSMQCGHCKDNEVCNHVDGSCEHGCKAGFQEPTCHACQDNTYGVGCQPCSIHCAIPCDKYSETGSCSSTCDSGYIGDNCTKECPPGKYGVKCRSTCYGNCKGDCDIVDGVCKDGCIDGWTGQHCDNKESPQKTDPFIIAVVVSVAAIIVALIITGGIIYVKRMKRQTNQGVPDNTGLPFSDISKAREFLKVDDAVKEGNEKEGFSQDNQGYERIGERDSAQPQYEIMKVM